VTDAYIEAARQQDVVLEVEEWVRRGSRNFTLRSIDHGGMLDRERLGAARYAAGVQAGVRLDADEPAAAAPARPR